MIPGTEWSLHEWWTPRHDATLGGQVHIVAPQMSPQCPTRAGTFVIFDRYLDRACAGPDGRCRLQRVPKLQRCRRIQRGNPHNMQTRHRHCNIVRGSYRGAVGRVAGQSPCGSYREQLEQAKSSQDPLPCGTEEPAAILPGPPQVENVTGLEHFSWRSCGSAALLSAKTCKPFQVYLIAVSLSMALVSIAPPAHASIAEAVSTSLRDVAPDWLVVLVLASLPVVELRGAVPIGISILGLPPPVTYALAVMGNMIPVPLILLGLRPLVKASAGVPPVYKLLELLLSRARKQTHGMDRDTIFMGLAYFVAVPLPGTGAWSGAIAAFVLELPFWPAVLSNFLGVCCAGALVTMLTCMGWTGLWLAIIILLILPLVSVLVKSMQADPRS